MANIKNYKEFLIEQRRINLDLGRAKERGEMAAMVFNQTLDSVLKSVLGKYDKNLGDLIGGGQQASMKLAQILIECTRRNIKLALVISALISSYGVSKVMVRNSLAYVDQATRQEILQDSSTVDSLALAEKPIEKVKVNTGKKIVEIQPLGMVTDTTQEHESNELRVEDEWGCGQYHAPRSNDDGTKRDHNGIDLLTGDGGGEIIYTPIDGYVKRTGFLVYGDPPDPRYHGIDIIGTGQDSGVIVRMFYVDASVKEGDIVSRGDTLGENEDLQLRYNPIRDRKKGYIRDHVHVEVKHTSEAPVELIGMDVESFQSSYKSSDFINPEEVMVIKKSEVKNKIHTPSKKSPNQGKKQMANSRGYSSEFFKLLALRESSNTWDTINTSGYMGKYQMSEEAIHDVAKKSRFLGHLSTVTVEGFREDSSIFNELDQEKAIRVHTQLNRRYLKYAPFKNLKVPGYTERFDVQEVDYYTHFDGQIIDSTYLTNGKQGSLTVTKSGVLGGCHLCGASSVKVFLDTGGKINPKDGNGIHVSEYMDYFKNYDLSDLITR